MEGNFLQFAEFGLETLEVGGQFFVNFDGFRLGEVKELLDMLLEGVADQEIEFLLLDQKVAENTLDQVEMVLTAATLNKKSTISRISFL